MREFFNGLWNALSSNATSAIITIALLFVLFFYVTTLLQRNNARWLIAIMVAYVAATGVLFMNLDGEKSPLQYVFIVGAFILAVLILFATEIKRDIWGMGAKKTPEIKRPDRNGGAERDVDRYIDEIVKATQNMSKNDVGAIIILANGNMPKAVVESGVVIDSEISSALIESVFFPKTPLHDGAMIINGSKIHAAGCFLPLSQEVNLPKELGTRHRAGIGVTETINVTALIVSEETGIISIAREGKIRRYVDSEMLRQTLKEYYWQELLDNKD